MQDLPRAIGILFRGHLRRLDQWPAGAAAVLGAGIAAFAIALLAVAPAVGAASFVVLLGIALLLAFSAEPIAVPVIGEVEHPGSPGTSPATPAPVRRQARPEADPDEPLLAWVPIPAGSFNMGSDESGSEKPIHRVTLSAFECMSVPVTRRLYRAVMGADRSRWAREEDAEPVTGVSWFEAVEFCNRWSQRRGLSPCYRIDGSDVRLEPGATGYRLLTEAEWEYAARAGSTSRWSFGDDEAQLGDYAWYAGNSGGEAHPVAQKRPNPWGLFDMHGNAWEWVADWFGEYPSDPQTDPAGPAAGTARVLRGGAFGVVPGAPALGAPVLVRSRVPGWNVGFRCARSPAASLDSLTH